MLKVIIADEYGNVLDTLEQSEGDFDFSDNGRVFGLNDIESALNRAHRNEEQRTKVTSPLTGDNKS